MDADIERQKKLLEQSQSLATPIARYGDMPRGGTPELNTVEAAAQDRIRREQDICRQTLNRDEVQRLLDRIDSALLALDWEEREVLKDFYFKNMSWEAIGYSRHYSERWARRKGGKGLKNLAFQIFGIRARPAQMEFVFIE